MATELSRKLFTDGFAYDLSKDIQNKGEIIDNDVIIQSIENILSTSFGERIFNPFFGSILPETLFETITEDNAEEFLESLINSVQTWEDRITIDRSTAQLKLNLDDNTMIIILPFIINKNNIKSTFKRKVVL